MIAPPPRPDYGFWFGIATLAFVIGYAFGKSTTQPATTATFCASALSTTALDYPDTLLVFALRPECLK